MVAWEATFLINTGKFSSSVRSLSCWIVLQELCATISPHEINFNGLFTEIMAMILPHENIFLVQENTWSLMHKNKTYELISSSKKSHELGIFLA